jgi:hypothetical protein
MWLLIDAKKMFCGSLRQGATELKPKGMICDSKDSCFTIIQSVEIISYLHYTVNHKQRFTAMIQIYCAIFSRGDVCVKTLA